MNRTGIWLRAFTVAAELLCPTAAAARDWPETAGWMIIEGDDYCGMVQEYEGKGDTQLTIGKFLDGHALVIIQNYGWSAKDGQSYDLEFSVGGRTFGGGKSIGAGKDYDRKGFVASFEPAFFDALAKGANFRAFMGETLVDSLNLDGSAAALLTVNRCLSSIRAVKATEERERQRFAHIPDDPFANIKGSAGSQDAEPDPAQNWVSADDYPPSSLRAEEEGTTKVTYAVNTAGRVEGCWVSQSSGSAALDQATCSAITRRGRFTPRLGPNGGAIRYDRSSFIRWKLPGRSQ